MGCGASASAPRLVDSPRRPAATAIVVQPAGGPPEPQSLARAFPVDSPLVLRDAALTDSYEVLRELGRGQFGRVHLARHRSSGAAVAIKTVNTPVPVPAELAAGEVEAMDAVRTCVHCVQLYEVVREPGAQHLVQECMGEELFERLIRRGAYRELEAAAAVRSVVAALAHLHEQGYVHRDVKPENILLSPTDGAVKLGDFGLAGRLPGPGCAKLTLQCGTWAYTAPEVKPRWAGVEVTPLPGYDAAVDMWSLGVVTYVLLCGHHPFDPHADADQEQIERAVHACHYDFTHSTWQAVSSSAKEFVRRCLVREPGSRMTAAQALAHPWLAVPAAATQRPTLATDDSRPPLHHATTFHRTSIGSGSFAGSLSSFSPPPDAISAWELAPDTGRPVDAAAAPLPLGPALGRYKARMASKVKAGMFAALASVVLQGGCSRRPSAPHHVHMAVDAGARPDAPPLHQRGIAAVAPSDALAVPNHHSALPRRSSLAGSRSTSLQHIGPMPAGDSSEGGGGGESSGGGETLARQGSDSGRRAVRVTFAPTVSVSAGQATVSAGPHGSAHGLLQPVAPGHSASEVGSGVTFDASAVGAALTDLHDDFNGIVASRISGTSPSSASAWSSSATAAVDVNGQAEAWRHSSGGGGTVAVTAAPTLSFPSATSTSAAAAAAVSTGGVESGSGMPHVRWADDVTEATASRDDGLRRPAQLPPLRLPQRRGVAPLAPAVGEVSDGLGLAIAASGAGVRLQRHGSEPCTSDDDSPVHLTPPATSTSGVAPSAVGVLGASHRLTLPKSAPRAGVMLHGDSELPGAITLHEGERAGGSHLYAAGGSFMWKLATDTEASVGLHVDGGGDIMLSDAALSGGSPRDDGSGAVK